MTRETVKYLARFMIEIYAIKIENGGIIQDYYSTSSLDFLLKMRQILAHSLHTRILQSFIGTLLVQYILSSKLNCNPLDITILLGSNGKPYCKQLKSCHFNISHSGEWIVCAFNNVPVGIDIQKIVPLPKKRMDIIVQRFFHKYEQMQYFNLQEDKREDFFFMQWAIKESYIKLLGKGLKIPLQGFSIFLDQNGQGSKFDGNQVYYFNQYYIDGNYKLIICSPNNSFPLSLRRIVAS